MRIRKKERLDRPIHVMSDDVVTLHYKEVITNPLGKEIVIRDEEVLSSKIGRQMTLTDAVIFDVEEGEFGDDVTDGIGGAFLQKKETYTQNGVHNV